MRCDEMKWDARDAYDVIVCVLLVQQNYNMTQQSFYFYSFSYDLVVLQQWFHHDLAAS